MISRAQVKLVRSLSQKKYRRKHALFKIEGPKVVSEALKAGIKPEAVFALPSWIDQNLPLLLSYVKQVLTEVSPAQLKELSDVETPQEVMALVSLPADVPDPKPQPPFALLLDGIRDPGNLGTILRTADWFGLKEVFLSPDCADPYNPKTIQATMGSILRIRTHETDLLSLMERTGWPAFAAALEGGKSLFEFTFPESAFLVIGNEAHGVSKEVLERVEGRVFIPRFGEAESLNAAMAAGILLNHWRMGAAGNLI